MLTSSITNRESPHFASVQKDTPQTAEPMARETTEAKKAKIRKTKSGAQTFPDFFLNLVGDGEGGATKKKAWRVWSQPGTKVAADALEDVAAWIYLYAVWKNPLNTVKPIVSGITWGLSGFTRSAHFVIARNEHNRADFAANFGGSLSNCFAGVGDTVAAVLSRQGASQKAITATQQAANGFWCISGAATMYDEAPRLIQHIREMRDSEASVNLASSLPLARSAVRTTAGLLQIAASVTGMAGKVKESAIFWGLGSTGDTTHTALAALSLLLKYLEERSSATQGETPLSAFPTHEGSYGSSE